MKLVVRVDCLYAPLTGIGHFTHNLLSEMIDSEEFESVYGVGDVGLIEPPALRNLLQRGAAPPTQDTQPAVASGRRVELYQHVRQWVRLLPFSRRVRGFLRGCLMRLSQKKINGAIYWEPSYTLLPIQCRAVTTVYDLSHLRFPEFHPAERVKLLQDELASSIAQAEHVVTISEFSKTEILDCFDVPADKVSIVYPAVDKSFRIYSDTEQQAIRETYSLPAQFIMSLATVEPRKNVTGLLKAFMRLPETLRDQFPLVLVGKNGWKNKETYALLKRIPEHQLIQLGYVPQVDLPVILGCATIMAYPSFYEGFGMPILESMACGVPVLTSNVSAMPEVGGQATLLINPFEIESISEGLQQLLQAPQLRAQLREQGLARAASYTWQQSSQQLASILKQAGTL